MKIKNKKIIYLLITLGLSELIFFTSADPIFELFHRNYFINYTIPVLKPVFQSTLLLIFTITPFLFQPPQIFRFWLTRLASWYIPIAIFMVSQVPVYGGSILSLNRTSAALWWAGALFVITCIYILLIHSLPTLREYIVGK